MLLTCAYVASSKTNLHTVCDVQAAPCDILFTHVSSAFAQLQQWQPKWMGSVLILGCKGKALKVLAAERACLGVRDLGVKRRVQKSMLSCQGVTRDCQTPLALQLFGCNSFIYSAWTLNCSSQLFAHGVQPFISRIIFLTEGAIISGSAFVRFCGFATVCSCFLFKVCLSNPGEADSSESACHEECSQKHIQRPPLLHIHTLKSSCLLLL